MKRKWRRTLSLLVSLCMMAQLIGLYGLNAVADGSINGVDTLAWSNNGSTVAYSSQDKTIINGRWNGMYGMGTGAYQRSVADPEDPTGTNMVASFYHSTPVRNYFRPDTDLVLATDFYLPTPAEGTTTQVIPIKFSSIFLTFTYSTENGNYTITTSNPSTTLGTLSPDHWVRINLYLKRGPGETLVDSWAAATTNIVITGTGLTDSTGTANTVLTYTVNTSIAYTDAKWQAGGAGLTWGAGGTTSGLFYFDNIKAYYPGSFTLSSKTFDTYGEGLGMRLDGTLTLKLNHDIDLSTFDTTAVTIKKVNDEVVTPTSVSITDLRTPNEIVISFANNPLEENTDYVLTFTDTIKDVTGQSLTGEINFETLDNPQDNALLASLTYNDGTGDVTVTGFDATASGNKTYNVLLQKGTTAITLMPIAANAQAAVVMTPADGIVNVAGGSGTATVEVTSADGSAQYTTTILFTVATIKLVTGVSVLPEALSLWADYKTANSNLTCIPKVTITPSDADNTTVVWSSSDPNIATVDQATGDITPVSEGAATITATAADGSGIFGSLALTVTPARNRAANQKLNLDPTSTARIDVETYLAWPQNIGEGQVAMWYNNATGAYTNTADDSILADFATWQRFYDDYGIPTTLFVPASKETGSQGGMFHKVKWAEAAAADGLDVQSHTFTHGDFATLTTAQMADDYAKGISTIESYTHEEVKVVAYASGEVGDINVARQFHIAGRGTSGYPNQGAKVNYNNTNSKSGISKILYVNDPNINNNSTYEAFVKSLYDKNYKVYGTSYYGGWTSLHFHNIEGARTTTTDQEVLYYYGLEHPDATPDEIAAATFNYADKIEYAFKYILKPVIDSGTIWAGTFQNVAMYGQERDTSTLTILSNTTDEISYTLTDEMDDQLFTYPLTVKIKVSPSWSGITATQNGAELEFCEVNEDGNKYVLVQTVPDRGIVVITPYIPPILSPGDVNGDELITIADLVMAAEIAVGCTGYTEEQIARANVSDKTDSIIDIRDVVLIANRISGDTAPFPVEQAQ